VGTRFEGSRVTSPPEETLEEPLLRLKLQGRRHRAVGATLINGIDAPPLAKAEARAVHGIICLNLPFDLQHREQVLLPMLARRAMPEDEFERLRQSLTCEYRALYLLCEPLSRGLADVVQGRGVGATEIRENARQFADRANRAFGLESSVLLPLAGVRLAPEDLDALSAALDSNRRLKRAARTTS